MGMCLLLILSLYFNTDYTSGGEPAFLELMQLFCPPLVAHFGLDFF